MHDSPLLTIALLAGLCAVCQWLAWRLRQPSIVFLLMAGLLVGPVLGVLDPKASFGDGLFPFVSIAVAIILFEGGLTLNISDIKGHGAVVTRLISVGVVVTWLLLTAAVHFIFDLSWQISFVFGSIAVVSGPTVIKPLLRTVRPSEKIGHLLHWEGILIDPVGVFLALLVFEYVLLDQPGLAAPKIILILAKLVGTGLLLGVTAGYAAEMVLRRYLVPDFLKNVLTLMFVVIVFALSESAQHESGLLTVTVMGIWLANARGLHIHEILHFKENLTVLLISTLFILLAARLELNNLPFFLGGVALLILVAQFIVRPINVWLCTLGSELSGRERMFIAWIAPRGIVAAAVSSLFALRLEEVGVPQTEYLVPLTFSLIIGTVVIQSFTAKRLADRLGISNPEPNGVLIHGVNGLSLTIATALRKHAIKVQFSDASWSSVRRARQSGFEAYHGNPTSGHAEENLDLQGIGKLLALSTNKEANALAAIHFRTEFGSESVFALESASDDDAFERFDTANRHRANPLFDEKLNYATLKRHIVEGEVVHVTLSDTRIESTSKTDKDVDDKTAVQTAEQDEPVADILENDLPMFAINKEGKLYVYGSTHTIPTKPGWTVVVLRTQE